MKLQHWKQTKVNRKSIIKYLHNTSIPLLMVEPVPLNYTFNPGKCINDLKISLLLFVIAKWYTYNG